MPIKLFLCFKNPYRLSNLMRQYMEFFYSAILIIKNINVKRCNSLYTIIPSVKIYEIHYNKVWIIVWIAKICQSYKRIKSVNQLIKKGKKEKHCFICIHVVSLPSTITCLKTTLKSWSFLVPYAEISAAAVLFFNKRAKLYSSII